MTEPKRVAVFPAGTEIGLELHQALQFATWFTLYGISSVEDHSRFIYRNLITGVPFVGQPGFLERINEALVRWEIDYLYPAHDSALLFLTLHREQLAAQVVAPELRTVEITRSKRKTYRFFEGEDFIPKIFESREQVTEYPVFLKPDIGQGAQGARRIDSAEEYFAAGLNKDFVLCEYLPGEECTVDCFTGTDGSLMALYMRSRDRVRSGISVASRILEIPEEVKRIAQTINARLRFQGAWFFQIKKDARGDWKLLEIAARVAGTSGLTRCAGVNLPLLTLYQCMGGTVEVMGNKATIQVDRALISRYRVDCPYDAVYVDLDDTLLLRNGRVNGLLLMFLYQAAYQGKRITLLTRHHTKPEKTLEINRISPGLFDRIVHLGLGEPKSSAIVEDRAIFIDDSFIERKEVRKSLGISVFDVDSVQCLIDWRA